AAPAAASVAASAEKPKEPLDYQKVYNAIAELLEDDNYDDGSYGPVFLRLAWHASGTFDKNFGNGGSYSASMRYKPEAGHAGRVDGEEDHCPPDGRLPDAGRPDAQHSRDVFYKMGFTDQEIVALIGAHALGRCHSDRSGFDGPWTASPTVFTNTFFTELLNRKWVERKWTGPKQFEDKESKSLMMLPADMAFAKDKEFRKWAEIYAKDEGKFFEDFSKACAKLFELGCKFDENTKVYEFKPTTA
ncbi:heme peroxidase, partial [Lunasporangiospora selenospora]